MKIEYLHVPAEDVVQSKSSVEVDEYLANLDGTVHNARAAQILCAASTWAYSDLTSFAYMMCHRGLSGEFVGINISNDAAFIDTTAYLFLSKSKRLAILTFRGTEPTNLINWLANVNAQMVPQEEGQVHGGFLNAALAILPLLKTLLLAVLNQREEGRCEGAEAGVRSLAEALYRLQGDDSCLPEKVLPKPEIPENSEGAPAEELKLFICGHSLGGAFAAMAGALIQFNPRLKPLRRRLCSIYTFGAPRFADRTMARTLDETIGDRVFRHRYGHDVVPQLPPLVMGRFQHFGHSYVNSPGGWVRARYESIYKLLRERPALGVVTSNIVGVLAFFKQNFPALQWLPMPMSWGDHSPVLYMRASQLPPSGWEILGPEISSQSRHCGADDIPTRRDM